MIPQHIAIIMDGNGRWAKARGLDRLAGHHQGAAVARQMVRWCGERGVQALTLFAFGCENWRRPQAEVEGLMELFLAQLQAETARLHKENVQVKIIGDRSAFNARLQKQIQKTEQLTEHNTGLRLRIAANYSGMWDICEAAKHMASSVIKQELTLTDINETVFPRYLVTADVPLPDLLIRTSGEQRISNFMLWQLAYAEIYFTAVMWPDVTLSEFEKALHFFASRERRFGCTSEQLLEVVC